ncbi:MAG: hypothetical protein KC550_05185 [Nanoarchaeota archaeon]|nr:hypothetical protein [Nanoarchaeota archaeon]
MKLNPNYSYEFNLVLNEGMSDDEQIKNFASLLSDKDRFLPMLSLFAENQKLIEDRLGFKLPKSCDFFVVRAEKFKSFSLPITIEYSILPEEMFLFLFKEILKVSINIRFPDDTVRELYVNSFIDYIVVNGNFGKYDLIKFTKNLHDESKRQFKDYEFKDMDFSSKTLKSYLEDLYKEF